MIKQKKKKQVGTMNFKIEDCFDFIKVQVNHEDCVVSGQVSVSNLPQMKKHFLQQIRGKNVDPTKGFLEYLRDMINRSVKQRHPIYGHVATGKDFEDDNKIIFSIDGMLYPQVPELKVDELHTVIIDSVHDEDYKAYLSAIKKRARVAHDSEDPIKEGDLVTIVCEFEGSEEKQLVRVDQTLREPLKSQLLNKRVGDEFDYEFEKATLDRYLDEHPEYAKYRKMFKNYKNIVSKMRITKVQRERQSENEEELIQALKLESQEQLVNYITSAVKQELMDINYAHYRQQLIEKMRERRFPVPKSLIAERMRLNKDTDHQRAEEQLMRYFDIEHLRHKTGIAEDKIYEIIAQHYGQIDNNLYQELRNMIILNSYIRALIENKLIALHERAVQKLEEARRKASEEAGSKPKSKTESASNVDASKAADKPPKAKKATSKKADSK